MRKLIVGVVEQDDAQASGWRSGDAGLRLIGDVAVESKDIGVKIAKLRKTLGITSTELANRAGITQPHVSRLENGKQGFRSATLARIAKALDVKPVYFYMDEDEDGGKAAEDTPVYGLAAGGKLVDALRSPEFVQVVEKIAEAFFDRKDSFRAIEVAAKVILGQSNSS